MAEPDLQKQLQQLRQANKIKDDALNHLAEEEEVQRQRWNLLRQVVDLAGDQYVSMRIDSVEESLRDQGAPLWLSCLLTIGVTLVPVSAITSSFLLGLTKSTQRMITASERATLEFTEELLDLGYKGAALTRAATRIPQEIIKTELMVSKLAKTIEPELSNTLQDVAHQIASTLGETPFKQQAGEMRANPNDAALVVVKRALHEWINIQVRAEGIARRTDREEIRDLYEIATSPEPAKAAKEVAQEIADRQTSRAPRIPLGTQQGWVKSIAQPDVDKLPKTNDDALKKLTGVRDRLARVTFETATIPDARDLRDLQLIIESAIWAATYDFTPRVYRSKRTYYGEPLTFEHWQPAPLPDSLWKKLVERYIDPDEGKSYKEVGYIERLGTKAAPGAASRLKWSPEMRLSHYFSRILFPQITKENGEVVRRLRALKA